MTPEALVTKIHKEADHIIFKEVIQCIDEHYNFTPTKFKNGTIENSAGDNNGSCKIFAFAKANKLSEVETLHCFGTYYRDDVLKHPNHQDHQNIRNFMQTGWQGIQFEAMPLEPK